MSAAPITNTRAVTSPTHATPRMRADSALGAASFSPRAQPVRARTLSAATGCSACRDLKVVESIGGDSQRPILQPYSRQLLLVHRLHDHSSWDTQSARCFGWKQNIRIGQRTPPSSKPSLPWMIRITVASSSWSPGASPDSRIASRASSSASNTRNASSRLRRSPGGTGSSSDWLTGRQSRPRV